MSQQPIISPFCIKNPRRLINDLSFCLSGTSVESLIMNSLIPMAKDARLYHGEIENLVQRLNSSLLHLSAKELLMIKCRSKQCFDGQIAGLILDDGGYHSSSWTSQQQNVVMGYSSASWVAFLWKTCLRTEEHRQRRDSCLLEIQKDIQSMTLLEALKQDENIGESELEKLLLCFSGHAQTVKEFDEGDDIWMKCSSEVGVIWKKLAQRWTESYGRVGSGAQGQLYFWRSIFDRYPSCLLLLKKGKLLELMITCLRQDLDKCCSKPSSSLQSNLESIRWLLWLEVLLKRTESQERDWIECFDYAKKCRQQLRRQLTYWSTLRQAPSMERGLNIQHHQKLSSSAEQIRSLLNLKNYRPKGMVKVQGKGDQLLNKYSKLMTVLRPDLESWLECLQAIQDQLGEPTSIENDVQGIWAMAKHASEDAISAFSLSIKHPMIKFRAQHRQVFQRYFSNLQLLKSVA